MNLEAEIHKAAKRYMTKRQQGCFMGEVRKLLKPVEYDRNLIGEMLVAYHGHTLCDKDLEHLESSIIDQVILLQEAEDADRAAKREEPYPPTNHAA